MALTSHPMERRLARRLVALAAAYAVAFGALLPFLAAAWSPATAADGLSVICSGLAHDGSGPGGSTPAKPLPLCPGGGACCMPGCATTILPEAGAAHAVARVSLGVIARPAQAGPRRSFPPGGRLARGPPTAWS